MARAIFQPAKWDDAIYQYNLFDDFFELVTGDVWTILEADGGADITIEDEAGGVVLSTITTTDNDESCVYTTSELFKFIADKSFRAVCRLSFAEANTSAQNILFGLMSGSGANSIVDNGAGPNASADMAVIYKLDGGTVWRCGSCHSAGTNPDNASDMTAGQGNSETSGYQTLLIKGDAVGSEMRITYHVDPLGGCGFRQLKTSVGNVIEDRFTIASATEMALTVSHKIGSTTTETLKFDYAGCSQAR